jgi:hypothetical protein
MKRPLFIGLLALVLGLLAAAAFAQSVPNPRLINFTASPDHQSITVYEVGWFLSGATSPVGTTDLGKPAPDTVPTCSSPVPCVEASINVMPLPFAEYTAKVRARAGTLYSEWSLPSNPFVRVPGSPGGVPVVKK